MCLKKLSECDLSFQFFHRKTSFLKVHVVQQYFETGLVHSNFQPSEFIVHQHVYNLSTLADIALGVFHLCTMIMKRCHIKKDVTDFYIRHKRGLAIRYVNHLSKEDPLWNIGLTVEALKHWHSGMNSVLLSLEHLNCPIISP